jgi:hypothetical protein
MERIVFESGEEPTVRTEDLCARSGGCDRCPGIVRAKDVGLVEQDPEEMIFCIHGCHLAGQ